MRIAVLCVYFAVSFLALLYTSADRIILLWPFLVLLFFGNMPRLALVAAAIGLLLDQYSPLLGVYTLLFPATAQAGVWLIHTHFSHRTFFSFISVSVILSVVFTFSEYTVFWLIQNVQSFSTFTIPEPQYFFAWRAFWLLAQFFVLSFCYAIARRFEKRFGYAIDTVRRI